ncbi:MAG: hypothetical protein Q7T25_00405 [Sideroxyarcus sp.]|nr:hypothetical protein [Sideroxyarcus sp.]
MTYLPVSSSCQHLGIAHSDIGNVVICPECGIVRISMEHMSLRLAPAAFRSLAQMLSDAQERIDNFKLAPQMPGVSGEAVDASQAGTPATDQIH